MRKIAISLIFLCLLGHILSIYFYPDVMNPDAANLTHMAMHLLNGQTPYVDYIDVNSPSIVYISAIPVIVANELGSNIIPLFSLLVLCFLCWGAANCYLLLKQFATESSMIHLYIPLVMLFQSLRMLLGFLGEVDFGEREHLFIVLYLPFLILRWMQWESMPKIHSLQAVTLGIIAAIATTLKPHFLLIALPLELYFLFTKRSFKPFLEYAWLAYMLMGILYVLHFLLLPKEALDNWLNYSLPLFSEGYAAWNPGDNVLENSLIILFGVFPYLLLIGSMLWMLLRTSREQQSPYLRLRYPLAIALIAALFLYLLQQKGFRYHFIPTALLMWILGILLFLDDVRPAYTRLSLRQRNYLVLGVILVLMLPMVRTFLTDRYIHKYEMEALIQEKTSRNDTVLIIHTEVWDWYRVYVLTKRLSASRHLVSMPIPMFYRADRRNLDQAETLYHNPDDYAPYEERYLNELASDIARNQPPLIFIQAQCQLCPQGFNVNDYLFQAEPLQAVLQNYNYLGEYDREGSSRFIGYCLQGRAC